MLKLTMKNGLRFLEYIHLGRKNRLGLNMIMKQKNNCFLKYVITGQKKAHFVLVLVLGFMLFGHVNVAQSDDPVDRIVAVVNDEIITLMDLKKAMAVFEKQVQAKQYLSEADRKALYEIRDKMLDKLIDEKLTDQEIERLQLTVSEKEIDDAIEQIKSKNYLTDEDLRSALANDGLTLEEYRDNLKKEFLRPRLINYQVKSKIIITDEDIKAYYDANKDQYAGVQKYHIWNLIARLSSFASSEEKVAASKTMLAAIGEIKQGVNIQDVVKDISYKSSNYSGGDLGLYKLDELSAVLKKAITGLAAGENTDVIDTPNGLQIFYVEEIVDVPGKSIKDVSSEISEKLYSEVMNEKFKSWLEGLREKSHIRIIK